jgi:DNA repair protein RecO (recombination protein O)
LTVVRQSKPVRQLPDPYLAANRQQQTVSDANRVQLQPAYVLHHRPYRDTSRILELFTRDHGRVSVFARGARGSRDKSASLASVLQPFNRVLVSWTGRGEAGQLTQAEFDGAFSVMPPDQLVNGYYVNELVLKLFARHDAHADVFGLYDATISALKVSGGEIRALRVFEKRLLEALGYGLVLHVDAVTRLPVDPDRMYHYRLEQGAVRALDLAEGSLVFAGSSLLSLAREEMATSSTLSDARRLLRAALDQCLDGRELKSRQVLLALRKASNPGTP